MEKAKYYEKLKEDRVKCLLCPHHCQLEKEDTGICQGRVNKEGELFSKNYGQITSIGVDPIEKKPLYHFYPDSGILSLGTFGCNFSCEFCQNWRISQQIPDSRSLSPEEVIEIALEKEVIGIAYTYSEPLTWFEFVLKTGKLARENNLKNVIVSNGFINREPLQELIPYLDGANIDVKSFTSNFYKKYAGGRLQPVLDNLELLQEEGIHLELTTLLIEDLNDSEEELKELFSWIENLNPDIPLHLSRYFPNYKMNKKRTSLQSMNQAYDLASRYLNFVYLGNVRGEKGQNTVCPECQSNLIIRNGYNTRLNLNKNECPDCGYELPGRFCE